VVPHVESDSVVPDVIDDLTIFVVPSRFDQRLFPYLAPGGSVLNQSPRVRPQLFVIA
jgi:hypothetical protein